MHDFTPRLVPKGDFTLDRCPEWARGLRCAWIGIGAAIAASIAGSVVSSGIQANAASNAANTQANAARSAAQGNLSMFDQIRNDLSPYTMVGYGAIPALQAGTGTGPGGTGQGPLNAPFTPKDLQNTPGYKFTLQQGTNAIDNKLAAQGLAGNGAKGFSGPQAKAVTGFATDLASTTYNQQLQNYLAQNQQIYNMLTGMVGTGQASAAQTGAFGTQAQTTAGALNTSAGAADAAGGMGAANALAGGIGNSTNSLTQMALINRLYPQGFRGGATP